MSVTLVLLATLIAVTPLVAQVDGPVLQGAIAILGALSLAITAWSVPPGEARYLSRILGPVVIGLAVPAIWMAIQAAPIPLKTVSNPIWASVETALGEPGVGGISIDPGITLVVVVRYLTVVSIVIVTAAVAVERRRAEMLLFGLTAGTTLAAITLVIHNFVDFPIFEPDQNRIAARSWVAECTLGVPIAAAAIGHIWERLERARENTRLVKLMPLACCLGGLAICFGALLHEAQTQMLLIAISGLAMTLGIAIIRRLAINPWFAAASAITALIVVAGVLSIRGDLHEDVTLRYADAPARTIAIAERVLADSSWAGAGAGAFVVLAPIYSDADDPTRGISAPTAAAEVAIELGRPMLWIAVAMVVLAVGRLLNGALTRGRDSLYPLAAASSLFTCALMCFVNASVFATSVALLAAATSGLGIAQSVSRSALP